MKICRILTVTAIFIVGLLSMSASGSEKVAEKPLLIDVRTEAEWNEGHLEGAILIPYEKIGEVITAIAPDKKTKIQLYCRSGRRSGIALDTLKKLGYDDVSNYGSVKDTSEKLNIPVVK